MKVRPVTFEDILAGMALFDAFDDCYQCDAWKSEDGLTGVVRLIANRTEPAPDVGPQFRRIVIGTPVLYDLQFVLKNFRVVDLTDPIYSPQPPDTLNTSDAPGETLKLLDEAMRPKNRIARS